ncbi:hypothetical protein [Salinarimonas soli]|uniref:hypothetical protein n=1 Tax=Salinarimonas soli TaxID=1638099 RepID=UPI001661E58E|nr:hypothetical protein [Salinarimonas soli]
MTNLNASALDTDPRGMDLLRAVIGPVKRQPAGEAGFREAEARSERRRAPSRREARASL